MKLLWVDVKAAQGSCSLSLLLLSKLWCSDSVRQEHVFFFDCNSFIYWTEHIPGLLAGMSQSRLERTQVLLEYWYKGVP